MRCCAWRPASSGRCSSAIPGQLDPFSTVEVDRWTGLSWDPMQSAVAVLLRHNPDLPVHRLPVSWRLPASAAPVVAEAFYPFTGFRSGTGPGDRTLSFGAPARDHLDDVLDTAAATGWGLHELPARHTIRTDAEAAAAVRAAGRPRRCPAARSTASEARRRAADRRPDRDRRRAPRPGRRDPLVPAGRRRPASRSTPPTGCRAASTT